jgi:hypothetical protein
MNRNRFIILFVIATAVVAGLWFWRDAIFGEPHSGRIVADEKSTDVADDLKLMWETRPLTNPDATHGPNPRCSTHRAINAASRVFNTVALVGETKEKVIELLGDPKSSSDSTYNFPFYPPASRESLVYRFDTGAYGWQFEVVFDDNGLVKNVERHGIE